MMISTNKVLWGVAALASLSHSAAMAQETATEAKLRELSERIERMHADYEKQIGELRQQQKGLASQAATPAAAPAAGTPEPVLAGEMPGSVRIPGTQTSIKVGGYARLDVVKDFGGGEFGAIGLPQNTPFGGTPQSTRKGYFNMNSRQSRLNLRTLTQTAYGPVTTFFEGDFLGAGGNEAITNSSALRLRHAYVQAGDFLAGQTWTNFVDLLSLPETLDFYGGNGPLQGVRAPQLRYTVKWSGKNQFSIAAENPEADIFGTVTTTISAASSPTNTATLDKAPDINARYQYVGDWGRIGAAVLVRRLTFNNAGTPPGAGFVGESSVTTTGWVIQGKLNSFGSDTLQYSFADGAGVARYILGTVNNSSAVIEDDKLKGIREKAIAVAYTRVWTPAWRSNLIYGVVTADMPHPAVPAATPSRVAAVYANVIWSPVQYSLVGLEWEHSMVKNDTVSTAALSNRGTNSRVQMSFQYGF